MNKIVLGRITLEITCADCAGLLNRINNAQIGAQNIIYLSDLELCITISGRDYFRLLHLVRKQGGTLRIKRISKIHRNLYKLKKHPVILGLLVLLLMVTVYVPRRVFFVSVVGNTTIPDNRIIEAAEACGLRFGSARRSVRSEFIKNTLLEEIPQLQWAGVNTKGCIATISVREKTTQDVKEDTTNQVSSVIANRDGIIQSCTVYQGTPLCAAGQVVKAGQTLVSGYTDCGLTIRATRAEAEITALTFRDLEVYTPSATTVRNQQKTEKNIYAIRIGKKLINLSKDSGNPDTRCVKIYSERSVCLPGGFCLPISIIKITSIYYDTAEQATIATDKATWLEEFSVSYLKGNMIAGKVISSQTDLAYEDGFAYLRGRFACVEMIGQVKNEQKLLKD